MSIDFNPFLQKKRQKCYYETCTVLNAMGEIGDRCSAHKKKRQLKSVALGIVSSI